MSALDTFRAETRDWLAANCPPGARGAGYTHRLAAARSSLRTIPEPGSTTWQNAAGRYPPGRKEYGGAELSLDEYNILIDELKRIDARPPLTGRGVNYIGPTILELGSDDQKARWLPGISRGEGAWAMGYSEPGAGSDLASLALKAELNGDNYVLNGRKTWTSDAMDCDYIFVLARTSPDKPKHKGISLILVDMAQPEVTVRPIRLISGASPFNETLFEDALAPAVDVIGGVDNGWTVGKRLLQFERSTHAGINVSGSQGGMSDNADMPTLLRSYVGPATGKLADTELRDRLTRFEMNGYAQRLTQKRAIQELEARAPGFTSSAVKLTGALQKQDGDELKVLAMGTQAVGWGGDAFSSAETRTTKDWLYQKSLTIAGGTKEVQLNIIAKRVLGLPD